MQNLRVLHRLTKEIVSFLFKPLSTFCDPFKMLCQFHSAERSGIVFHAEKVTRTCNEVPCFISQSPLKPFNTLLLHCTFIKCCCSSYLFGYYYSPVSHSYFDYIELIKWKLFICSMLRNLPSFFLIVSNLFTRKF